MHTQESLLTDAAIIRDETQELANTAERVGTMHQHTVEALFENVIYTSQVPVEVPMGRIAAGTNLAGRSILSILADAFRAPQLKASVSLSGTGVFEKGLLNGVDVALAGAIAPNSDTIAARRIRRTVGNATTIINSPATNSVAFTDVALRTSASYVLEADTAASGTKSSGVVSVTLVAATYYGVVASLTPTEAQIKALTKRVWAAAERAVSYSNDNQRAGFFEPKSTGKRLLIRDQNGYDVTADFTYSEALFTLPDGTQEAYSCYVLTDAAGVGTPFIYTFFH